MLEKGLRCLVMRAFDFIKFLLAALGLLAVGTTFLAVLIVVTFQPNVSIVIGDNNNVNQKIDSRSVAPLPQPTVQAQTASTPAEQPKETSSNEETPTDVVTDEPEDIASSVEPEETPYPVQPVVKKKRIPAYREASTNLDEYYPDDYDDNYQDTFDSRNNNCPYPVRRVPVDNYDDDEDFEDIRPRVRYSQETEYYEETYTSGGTTTTIRRSVTQRVSGGSSIRIRNNY